MATTPKSHHDPSFFLTADDFLLPPPTNYSFSDDVLLTRRLPHSTLTEKQQLLFSTSPQSTLTGFGPFSNRTGFSSRVPSPSETPPGASKHAGWDLLYEAAAQVARLKMNAILLAHNRGRLLEARRNPNHPSLQTPVTENFHCPHHRHPRRSSVDEALGRPQSAWPKETGMKKRQSAGTGVFLPRRPGSQQTFPAEAGGSPVLFPARAQNLNLDEMNRGGYNANSQAIFGRRLAFHREMIASRRKSFVEDERRSATMAGHNEVSLPSDWTY